MKKGGKIGRKRKYLGFFWNFVNENDKNDGEKNRIGEFIRYFIKLNICFLFGCMFLDIEKIYYFYVIGISLFW